MDRGTWLILWGSPVGIAVFFAGLGVLLWGVAKLKHSQLARSEFEMKERQLYHERAQAKEGGAAGSR